MRRHRLLLVVVVLLVTVGLAACGDDSDPDGTESEPSGSPASSTTVAAPDGDSDPDDSDLDGSAAGPEGCAGAAQAGAADEAYAVFPDNPDVDWTVVDVAEADGGVVVELEPTPDEVGYSRFRFLYGCEGDEPVRFATYALDDGAFVLLATTDAAPPDLASTLD